MCSAPSCTLPQPGPRVSEEAEPEGEKQGVKALGSTINGAATSTCTRRACLTPCPRHCPDVRFKTDCPNFPVSSPETKQRTGFVPHPPPSQKPALGQCPAHLEGGARLDISGVMYPHHPHAIPILSPTSTLVLPPHPSVVSPEKERWAAVSAAPSRLPA